MGEELQFHLYSREEQERAELGLTSVALCGFIREGDQREHGVYVKPPVDAVECEDCSALLPAAYEMLSDEDKRTVDYLGPRPDG